MAIMGRSVAWGAKRFPCPCIIYIHEHVSEGRKAAIEAFGAEVRRVAGTYDDSVRQAALDAEAGGWDGCFQTRPIRDMKKSQSW